MGYWETTVGASTFIFRELNSKANSGLDSITAMLRFLCKFPFVSLSFSNVQGPGPETLAVDTALNLKNDNLEFE